MPNEFELSIIDHAVTSGRGANCFFQSFIHTLTNQSEYTLDKIQKNYPVQIKILEDTFNTQLTLDPPVGFKKIMEISRQLHPLERECLFGPILRHTYNVMVEQGLLDRPLLKHDSDAILLQHQTVQFSNAFGADIRAYMSQNEFDSAIEGGMPSEVEHRIRSEPLNINVDGKIFYCDRTPYQNLNKEKLFDINIVYANQHLNYTLGTRALNHNHTEQIITERTTSPNKKLIGIFAAGAVDKNSAPLAKEGGLTFSKIISLLCERFNLSTKKETQHTKDDVRGSYRHK